jgi:acyl-[acyl-carrier-protein] desaturase
MQKVVARWEIDDKITGLTDEMEKGAWLSNEITRMTRVSERMTIPQESHILNG